MVREECALLRAHLIRSPTSRTYHMASVTYLHHRKRQFYMAYMSPSHDELSEPAKKKERKKDSCSMNCETT
jgi:hypothetical protein